MGHTSCNKAKKFNFLVLNQRNEKRITRLNMSITFDNACTAAFT